MKLKPYYLGLVMLILLGLTASSAFGVGSAGTVTGGTFPACIDPANTNTSTVKIGGKQVAPGGLVRAPVGTTCLSSETTLNLNSYVKTILVSPGPDNVVNGNNLRTAVNNAPTRTLVKVEPGTFDLATTPLIMKQGVDLEGSGEGLTTITSQIVSANLPLTSGTVVLASSSEVRFLSILNTGNGGSTLNSAVYSTGVNITSKLTNVTVSTNGNSSGNYGIYNNINSSPSIQNTTISATGGSINYGFYNYNSSSPTIENSTISVGVGSSNNYGIYNVFIPRLPFRILLLPSAEVVPKTKVFTIAIHPPSSRILLLLSARVVPIITACRTSTPSLPSKILLSPSPLAALALLTAFITSLDPLPLFNILLSPLGVVVVIAFLTTPLVA